MKAILDEAYKSAISDICAGASQLLTVVGDEKEGYSPSEEGGFMKVTTPVACMQMAVRIWQTMRAEKHCERHQPHGVQFFGFGPSQQEPQAGAGTGDADGGTVTEASDLPPDRHVHAVDGGKGSEG